MLEINEARGGCLIEIYVKRDFRPKCEQIHQATYKIPYIRCVGLSSRGVIIQVSFVRTKTNGKCASEFIKLQLLMIV